MGVIGLLGLLSFFVLLLLLPLFDLTLGSKGSSGAASHWSAILGGSGASRRYCTSPCRMFASPASGQSSPKRSSSLMYELATPVLCRGSSELPLGHDGHAHGEE